MVFTSAYISPVHSSPFESSLFIVILLHTLVKLVRSRHFLSFDCLMDTVRLLVCIFSLFIFCYHSWWIKMFITEMNGQVIAPTCRDETSHWCWPLRCNRDISVTLIYLVLMAYLRCHSRHSEFRLKNAVSAKSAAESLCRKSDAWSMVVWRDLLNLMACTVRRTAAGCSAGGHRYPG